MRRSASASDSASAPPLVGTGWVTCRLAVFPVTASTALILVTLCPSRFPAAPPPARIRATRIRLENQVVRPRGAEVVNLLPHHIADSLCVHLELEGRRINGSLSHEERLIG